MDILKYCAELDDIMSESSKKKRLLKENAVKKPVKNFQNNRRINENYGNDGYMYLTKHGLGPGTLPKDVHLLKSKDLPHYMTAIWLDRFLTTDELKKFDIYPETEIRRVMDFYDISEKDLLDEAYVNPETGENINNIYGMTNIEIEVEDENRIVVYADTDRFGKHEIMAECNCFRDAFDYIKRELGCSKLDYTTMMAVGAYTDRNGETFPTDMWNVRPAEGSMRESLKESLSEDAKNAITDAFVTITDAEENITDDDAEEIIYLAAEFANKYYGENAEEEILSNDRDARSYILNLLFENDSLQEISNYESELGESCNTKRKNRKSLKEPLREKIGKPFTVKDVMGAYYKAQSELIRQYPNLFGSGSISHGSGKDSVFILCCMDRMGDTRDRYKDISIIVAKNYGSEDTRKDWFFKTDEEFENFNLQEISDYANSLNTLVNESLKEESNRRDRLMTLDREIKDSDDVLSKVDKETKREFIEYVSGWNSSWTIKIEDWFFEHYPEYNYVKIEDLEEEELNDIISYFKLESKLKSYIRGEADHYRWFGESVRRSNKKSLKEDNNKYIDKVIVELDDEDGDYAYEVRGNKLHNKYGFYQGVIILEDDESQERLKKLGIKPGDEFVVGIRKPTPEEHEMYDDAMDDTFYMTDILYRYNESLRRKNKRSLKEELVDFSMWPDEIIGETILFNKDVLTAEGDTIPKGSKCKVIDFKENKNGYNNVFVVKFEGNKNPVKFTFAGHIADNDIFVIKNNSIN